MGSRKNPPSAGAARARAGRIVGAEGTGSRAPINAAVASFSGAERRFARSYANVLLGGGNVQNAVQTASDNGMSQVDISTVQNRLDAVARRQTDRRRGANR